MGRFTRIVISLTIILFCAFGVLAEENATITGDGLRIRSAPSTDSDILGTVNTGTRIEALARTPFFEAIDGINARWYAVRYQDIEGYVFGGYLNMDLETIIPLIPEEDFKGMEIPEQTFRIVWEASGRGEGWLCLRHIRYSNGLLYCFDYGDGVRSESVMLLDALSGEELWTLEGANAWYREPSFPPFEELVYYYEIFSHDPSSDALTGALTAFDARSGERVWSFDPGPSLNDSLDYFPAFDDERVFIANAEGRCWALDADTGSVVWDRVLGESCHNPYVSNGTLYVMTRTVADIAMNSECAFHAIDPSTGETIWENDSCADNSFFNRYIPSDDILYCIDDNAVTAIDTHSGDEVWSRELENEIEHTPVVYEDILFVWDLDYEKEYYSEMTLYALDRSTGSEMWRFRGFTSGLGGLPPPSPIEVTDGRVYVFASISQPKEDGYVKRTLIVLDAETGRTLWTFDRNAPFMHSVAFSGDNVYFCFCPSDDDQDFGKEFLMVLDAATGEEVMRMEIDSLSDITTDGERIYVVSHESLLTGEREGDFLSSLEFVDR